MRMRTRLLGAVAALLGCAAFAPPAFVPVLPQNFPDPYVVEDAGRFIAYSTNSAGINLPIATSADLTNWDVAKDPADPAKPYDGMPVLASWVREGRTWAPEVMQVGGR